MPGNRERGRERVVQTRGHPQGVAGVDEIRDDPVSYTHLTLPTSDLV